MTVRAAVRQTIGTSEQIVNVMNFQGLNDADIIEVYSRLFTFYDSIKGQLSTDWKVQGIDLGLYQPDGSAPTTLSREPATPIVGGASGDMLPNQVALCVSLRGTLLQGRHGRGRFFLGGFPENANVLVPEMGSYGPSASVASTIGAAVTALIGDPEGNTQMVIRRRDTGAVTPVVGGYIDRRWDTQRRRAKDLRGAPRYSFPA